MGGTQRKVQVGVQETDQLRSVDVINPLTWGTGVMEIALKHRVTI